MCYYTLLTKLDDLHNFQDNIQGFFVLIYDYSYKVNK